MLTTLVENFPGIATASWVRISMGEMRAQAERFGAEIIQGNVDPRRSSARGRSSSRRPDAECHADALIIATGASAQLLGLPSERKLMGHGVSTCATCDGYFFRGHEIAVVGGGDSAMEEAVFLTQVREQGDRRAPARHAARVEDHAGQGAREPEDRVAAQHRDRRDQGHRARAK